MKRTITTIMIVATAALLLLGGVATVLPWAERGARAQETPRLYDSLYVDAMHPWEVSEGPGTCSICGMSLSRVENHEPGTPMPDISELYVLEENPMRIREGNREGWIPITESPYYMPPEGEQEGHEGHDDAMGDTGAEAAREEAMAEAEPGETLWTCGMHPEVIQDEPGICPICQMDLTPLKQSTAGGSGSTVTIDPVTLQNIGVTTTPVERRDLAMTIRTNGTVEVSEDREVIMNSRVAGWIEKLHVSRTGEKVRRGQPLLDIYSPELVSAQEEYLLALKSGESFASSSLASVAEQGRDLIESARRRLELWNIPESEIEKLKRTREVTRTMTLDAPASGHIIHKNAVEGSKVQAGQDLFRIADLGRIWVIAQVYEYEAGWVREGDRVKVTSPYDPELAAEGTVDYIYPTLDQQSRTLEVRIVLSNENLAFKPDMYVDAVIQAAPRENVVAVPKSAVIRSGTRDLVFVRVGPGEFEPRRVHLGLETDRYYEITHNLNAGERVVTSAQFLLDSEARLQEAIQRRITARKQAGKDADTMEDDGGSQAGHVH